MKIFLFGILLSVVLLSCEKDDDPKNDNPNLIDPLVSLDLNLNLPQYNPLKFPGESVIITEQGIRGIVVYNLNNDLYTAFDLSDPNHPPNSCSGMTVEVPIARCPCTDDDNEYFITSGQHTADQNLYPMQAYRAVRTGDIVRITN